MEKPIGSHANEFLRISRVMPSAIKDKKDKISKTKNGLLLKIRFSRFNLTRRFDGSNEYCELI
jgi:hypothetical protein